MFEDHQLYLVWVGAQAITLQPAEDIFQASCCSCDSCAVRWASREDRPVVDEEVKGAVPPGAINIFQEGRSVYCCKNR
jgi:hypothetical protein